MDFAFDGEQAVLSFLKAPEQYDAILMDLQMPGMDGFEATRHIRASRLPRCETIPIIAMTAHVFREDVERCFASGMNGHLSKPMDYATVIAALSAHLLRRE
jgi:CheY-like chemotaxis protein